MGLREGMALLQSGRWEQGAAELRTALAVDPGNAAAWSNLGFALRCLGRGDEARAALERAVTLEPRLADAWNLLGLVEQDAARHDEACEAFGRAIESRAGFAVAWMNRANSEQALGHVEAALAGYAEALRLEPGRAEIHYNLGMLRDKAGDLASAERHCREAVRLQPAYTVARLALGHVLVRAERLEEAIGTAREAVRLQPDHAEAHVQLAHCLFLAGRIDEAWHHNQWRESRIDYVRARGPYSVPPIESLAGERVDVIGQQGLGDIVFFLRFAPELVQRGALLRFVGEPRLHSLLLRTGLFESVGATGEFRAGAPTVLTGDLPLLSGKALAPPLRLPPDPERLAAMRRRMEAAGPAPRVAIAWRAGLPHGGSFKWLFKEAPLEPLGAALARLKGTWISVQRDAAAGELPAMSRALGAELHDFSDTAVDLDDALALMTLADEYVGVSSTNVHFRAGTGLPARVLVPFPPEWRWMMRGESAWFPGMATYRQQPGGSWDDALASLARDLAAR